MSMELELKVICGNHLSVRDIMTSDPYVKFKLNGKKYKTKKINATLHPKWKERFRINVNVGQEITFECWDYDLTSQNDLMGKTKWIVPPLADNEKDYFILKFDTRGHIVISVKCLSGGVPLQLKRGCNPHERTVIAVNIAKCDGLLFAYQQNGVGGAALVGEFETSFGKYTAGVTKISSPSYCGPTMSMKRKMYIEARAGEIIKFRLLPATLGLDIMKGEIAKTEYLVPDLKEGEGTQFGLNLNPYGSMTLLLKGKRSVYHNVAEEFIPKKIDITPGPQFPCELTIVTVENGPALRPYANSNPLVKFNINGLKYKTGALMKIQPQNSPPIRPQYWYHSFIVPYCVNMKIKFSLKTALSQISDDKTIGKSEFYMPPDLMNENSKEFRIALSNGQGNLLIEIKRIRELSWYYRQTYINPQMMAQQGYYQGGIPPQH